MTRDNERLDELQDHWLAAAEAGRPATAAELCADCPELIPALEERLVVLRRFHQIASEDRQADTPNRSATSEAARSPAIARAGESRHPPSTANPKSVTGSFENILSACEAFAAYWSTASRPLIQDALARVGVEERPPLLRNLLGIELDRRRSAGEQPHLNEYISLFPEYASVIREVFLDMSSLSMAGGETDHRQTPAKKLPLVQRLGNYRLVRELGRGGMGVVYEAVHAGRGTRVALKTLPSVDGASLSRFKREFRTLVDFNHPNLIGLHTLEADGNHWFFTMDLVEGTDFLSYVRPRSLDESRLRAALAQLVTGVMALHARHVVHRDLKPSNVMVGYEGRVVLLDFGLVTELDKPGQSRSLERIAGTPRYMAPEQAAASMATLAADWYAVGVMLYEALSGKSPFSGPLWQIVHDKQTRDAPPLPTSAEIPADLAELCMRLLARDPRNRPNALAIARAVSAVSIPAPSTVDGGQQELVGRTTQLAALMDSYRNVQKSGEPATVFISGRSGEGKTALADQFLAQLRKDGRSVVMSGRCYDRESVPFKALDSLIDALGSYLRSLPETEAALLMPDDIGLLAQVFPVLQRVEVVAQATDTRLASLDEQQVRQRAFRALRSLLGRISRRSPIVWFVDDLQWGDADSATALFEVLRPTEAPPLLFIGTYRSDETAGSAFLQMWKELGRKNVIQFSDVEVKVGPLSPDECAELAVGLLGRDTEAIRRRARSSPRIHAATRSC